MRSGAALSRGQFRPVAVTYVVWVEQGGGQYARSDDLSSLAEVLVYIAKETYGHDYEVTKLVDVQLVETPKAGANKPMGRVVGDGQIVSGQAGMAVPYFDPALESD